MKEEFIKLTNATYKVVEFFPEADPLKNRAKDKALAIMDALTILAGIEGWASFQNEKTKAQILEDIDLLLGYLWIGKQQGWLSAINYFIISNGYEKIKKSIKPKEIKIEKLPEPEKIEGRKGKIIDFLSKNEKVQVMDLQKVLPNVTKRTIRRDLDELLGSGRIVRMGEFNQVFYKIAS